MSATAISSAAVASPLAAIADAVSEALSDDVVSYSPTRLDIAIGETDLTFKADADPECVAGKMEADLRAMAEKLRDAADAIRESEQERRRRSGVLADRIQTMRDVLTQHFKGVNNYTGDFTLEEHDDPKRGGVEINIRLRQLCGSSFDTIPATEGVVNYLRAAAGRLAAAAAGIDAAFHEQPGILLYELEPCSREIHTTEFNDVRFLIDNTKSEAEAIARVREFLAGLQVAGVAG